MQGDKGFGDILDLVRDLRQRCDFDRALTLDTLRPTCVRSWPNRGGDRRRRRVQDCRRAGRHLPALRLPDRAGGGAPRLHPGRGQRSARHQDESPPSPPVCGRREAGLGKAEGGGQGGARAAARGETVSVPRHLPPALPELRARVRFQERAASVGSTGPTSGGHWTSWKKRCARRASVRGKRSATCCLPR